MTPVDSRYELEISLNYDGKFLDGDRWHISVWDGGSNVTYHDNSILWLGIFICWIKVKIHRAARKRITDRTGYHVRKKVNW